MARILPIGLFLAGAIITGCQETSNTATPVDSTDSTKTETLKPAKLQTRLGTVNQAHTKDSATISFTVINDADSVLQFCKWETPFEPRLGKFLEVTDSLGTEASFMGAMARRVMPPPAEAYISVPAHDSVSTLYNLAKNYSVSKGTYTVKYTGGGVSGLDSGNKVSIIVSGR